MPLPGFEQIKKENSMEEIWKDVIGYEGLYQISNIGRLKSLGRISKTGRGGLQLYPAKIRKTYKSGRYESVILYKDGAIKSALIHRLVAMAFIPGIKGRDMINHIDGIRLNNNVSNLEWCDALGNSTHARLTGLMRPVRGEMHPMSKLTYADVAEIRILLAQGKTAKHIAEKFNVCRALISQINTKRIWNA